MNKLQLQVINSPFNDEQTALLNKVIPTLTDAQKNWLSGYLTATLSTIAEDAPLSIEEKENTQVTTIATPITKEITVLYGSQTGNAQSIAQKTAKQLTEHGFEVIINSMNDFRPANLKKLKNLLIIVSTHGEGEPPDTAIAFHEFLHGKRAPKLDNLSYSVLSLGDSSYEFFCQTGKEFDERLKALGGKRIYSRVDCDLDYDDAAEEWFSNVIAALNNTTVATVSSPSSVVKTVEETEYTRSNPFQAEVLDIIRLNGRGSNKETFHIELSLEGSGITYEPGDSLGIFPTNDPELVDSLLNKLGFLQDDKVTINKQGDNLSIRDALLKHVEVTVLTKSLMDKAAKLTKNNKILELINNEEALKTYIKGRDVFDLVNDFDGWEITPQEFLSILRKLPARLYSIASSYSAYPEEAHLTIGAVRYHTNGRDRNGVCSIQCAERLQPGDTLPIYIQKNQNFKLPANPSTPIIMVGPGTGVAPFRAFLQEREEIGATGKSWLFFGEQHFVTDFLYQTEWQKWKRDGILTKIDVAFSRDTAEKVYVQHRMLEHSKELYEWLEEGAVIYICGDEKNMAHDVHETLLAILMNEGNLSKAQAENYVASLQKDKRYQRDVY